jgi:hypothetical protein
MGSEQQVAHAAKLVADGAYAEAERMLRTIVSASPNNPRAWHELGNACFRSGAFDRAATAYLRRVNLEPGNALANYSLGAALAEWGRADEARAYLQRALQLQPNFPQAARRLAHLDSVPTMPSPVPVKEPAEKAPIDKYDPGRLIMAGRPRFSSFIGRFMIVALLAGLSTGIGLIEVPYDFSFIRWVSGISNLEDQYDYVSEHFPEDSETRNNTKQAIKDREDAVQTGADVVGGGLLVGALLLALHSLAAAALRRYHVYEWRIDVQYGAIRRVAYSVWLWEVIDVVYHQPLGLRLTNTAEIVLSIERSDHSVSITGLASAREMRALWGEIRARAYARRRDDTTVRGKSRF